MSIDAISNSSNAMLLQIFAADATTTTSLYPVPDDVIQLGSPSEGSYLSESVLAALAQAGLTGAATASPTSASGSTTDSSSTGSSSSDGDATTGVQDALSAFVQSLATALSSGAMSGDSSGADAEDTSGGSSSSADATDATDGTTGAASTQSDLEKSFAALSDALGGDGSATLDSFLQSLTQQLNESMSPTGALVDADL